MADSDKKSSYGFKIYPGEDPGSLQYTFYMDPPPIRVLSFKGGGSRVIVYTKFVEVMHEEGLLEQIEEVGGSSSGCIASAFAAIHYENPLRRTQALDEISRIKKEDVYGKKAGWKVYKFLTAPLMLISLPLEYLARGLDKATNKLNKFVHNNLLSLPLRVVSVVLHIFSLITNPRTYAALGNLIGAGGMYHGDTFQESVRDRIQSDTQAGLEAILAKRPVEEREQITARLVRKGVCTLEQGKLKVVPDVTFKHFYILSKLPGSQFKQYYTTGFSLRDKEIRVFNKDTAPDMPVHLAMRLAVTFPTYFIKKSYRGEEIIDGGIIDNSPVAKAGNKQVSMFKHRKGVTDQLARLNVRVEYPEEYKHVLWEKRPKMGRLAKLLFPLRRALTKSFTGGVDIFVTDAEVTHHIQEHYAQRTLQLPDFGIGQLVKKIPEAQRARVENELPALVKQYFENHDGEKAVIENYQHPKYMSPDVRRKLLKVLRNPEIKTAEIYDFPDKSPDELEELRRFHILQAQETRGVFDYQHANTANIFDAMEAKPSKPLMESDDEVEAVAMEPVDEWRYSDSEANPEAVEDVIPFGNLVAGFPEI